MSYDQAQLHLLLVEISWRQSLSHFLAVDEIKSRFFVGSLSLLIAYMIWVLATLSFLWTTVFDNYCYEGNADAARSPSLQG